MKKRIAPALLCLALLLQCVTRSPAADVDGGGEKTWFTDYNRDLRSGKDLSAYASEFALPDTAACAARAGETRELMADAENAGAVVAAVQELQQACDMACGLYSLGAVEYDRYYGSDLARSWYDRYLEGYDVYCDLWYIVYDLIGDVLASPCGEAMRSAIPAYNVVDFSSDGGDFYGDERLLERIYDMEDAYLELLDEGASYAEKASLFEELAALRGRYARSAGYDNYLAYQYDYLYVDGEPEDMADFHAAVKTYIPRLCALIEDEYAACESGSDLFRVSRSCAASAEAVRPYIEDMGDEVAAAYDYMYDHGFLLVEDAEGPGGAGNYTQVLPGIGVPVVYTEDVTGDFYDFGSVVHEFGHALSYFYHPADFYAPELPFDVGEVHSFGMEVMLSRSYPDLFPGGTDAQCAEVYLLDSLLCCIPLYSYFDELEYFIYTTPDVTAEQISARSGELLREYGIDYMDGDDWVDEAFPLISDSGYGICYAAPALAALRLWVNAQEDFDAALDDYLTFTALPFSLTFGGSFEAIGYADPRDPEAIRALAEDLCAARGWPGTGLRGTAACLGARKGA